MLDDNREIARSQMSVILLLLSISAALSLEHHLATNGKSCKQVTPYTSPNEASFDMRKSLGSS